MEILLKEQRVPCCAWIRAIAIVLLLGSALPGFGITANEVIQKAVERGEHPFAGTNRPSFSYRKISITEELDSSGKVLERKKKVWEVSIHAGSGSARLIEVNGRPPDAAELKKQNQNDGSVRELLGGEKTTTAENRDNFLTPALVSRFNFKFVSEQNLQGRKTYVLEFAPKVPPAPIHRMVDRMLNRLSGKLWIDSQEFELAQADLKLATEVNFLGGIAGRLRRMDYRLTRVRIADGVWVNREAVGDFEGRKLLESMRVKTRSETSGYKLGATG